MDLGDTLTFSSSPSLDTAFTRVATAGSVTSDVPFHRAVYNGDPDGDDIGIGGFRLAPVPEPKTAVLLGLGLAGLAAVGSPRERARR